MTDLQAFLSLHERLGVPVEEQPAWGTIIDKYPHAIAVQVENTCEKSYGMNSVYFFDEAGKFVTVGTWE